MFPRLFVSKVLSPISYHKHPLPRSYNKIYYFQPKCLFYHGIKNCNRYKNVALHFVASKYVHVYVNTTLKRVQGFLSKCTFNMDNVKLKFTWRTQLVKILPQIMTLNEHSICINSLWFN